MILKNYDIKPATIIVDAQNGFASVGGSYYNMGINIVNYRAIIPKVSSLISVCQNLQIPIFFTQSVRESTGNDLLTNTHKILPPTRQERIKDRPLCIQGTWDADIIDEFKPFLVLEGEGKGGEEVEENNVIIKRIDSVFHDTELDRRLKKLEIDALIFCGIDTSICVESSIRDAFNLGYDVILISDATASMDNDSYSGTLNDIRNFYGLVMDTDEFCSSVVLV